MKAPPKDPLMKGARGGEQIDAAVVEEWERASPPVEMRVLDGKVIAVVEDPATAGPPATSGPRP